MCVWGEYFLQSQESKEKGGLTSLGKSVTDLCSKGMSLRPLIKNTLAAILLFPCKPRSKLFSPTVPDTIWRHVKQFNNCVPSLETRELTFIPGNLLSLSNTLKRGLGYV